MADLSILVVDDDPMMLHMLPPHLLELGTQRPVGKIDTAATPEAALAALEALPPGPVAVLSDFNLRAAMNGLQLLAEVARRRPDSVRVLFSGYAADQIGDVGAGGVAHGFVEKPLRIREMLDPIRAIVDERLG